MTLVQRMIPERYLLAHAIYMQTCAHIEPATWHIVQLLEGFGPENPAEVERFLTMKRNTWTLIKALEASAGRCDPSLSARVQSLADRIKLGIENRNFAAHAAIHWDAEADALAAEHYFQRRINGKEQWLHTLGDQITDEAIAFAINDADSILLEAISLRTSLQV